MSITDVETEPHKLYDTILVLDFSAQLSHLLIRRMREFNVYAKLLPCTQKAADLAYVYEDGDPHVDPAWLDYGAPILGICYGMQELAYRLSPDNVIAGTAREYGLAVRNASKASGHVDRLFEGIGEDMRCWMSHGDKLAKFPVGFHTIATTKNAEYAAIGYSDKPIYAM